MKSIIEEFYYGNIEAQELNNGKTTLRLKKKLSEIAESEELFAKSLTPEEKERFSSLMEEYNKFSGMSNADSFISGFKLGARFACEMFI